MRWLGVVLIIVVWVNVSSCGWKSREDNKTQTETVEEYKGNIGGVPFRVDINKGSKSKTLSNSSKELEMDIDYSSIISLVVSLLGGGGLGALFMRNYKDGQIKEITDGVGEFINTKSSDVEKLLTSLSKKMSNNTKKVVRRVKG